MSKITVIGPSSKLNKVVNALYQLKIMHLTEHRKTKDLDIGAPLADAELLSEILVKIRSICSYLRVSGRPSQSRYSKFKAQKINIKKLAKDIDNLHENTNKNLDKIKEIENKLKTKADLLKKLEDIDSLNLSLESYREYESIVYFLGRVSKPEEFKEKLKAITHRFELKSSESEKSGMIALFADKNKSSAVQALLAKHHFTAIDSSAFSGMKGTPKEGIAKLSADISALTKQKTMAEKTLAGLGKKHKDFLLLNTAFLEEEAEKKGAPLKFASTENFFVVKGWVPFEKLGDAFDALNKATQKKVYIKQEEIEKTDSIPVKMQHPQSVKPFEFFMNLYTLPKYTEIDPTFFVFLTFPLLFGFMLGDMGYGLTTLIFFLWLRKKLPYGRDLLNVLIYASISSIFFGALFGEFFGFEEIMHFELPHILSRAHQINLLMYIAVGIGIIHVNLGLILGFFNELKAHGIIAAVFEKLSWILFEISMALLALSYMNLIPIMPIAGYVLLAVSLLMLFKGEGVKGLMELPSIFSNILSYARLMAIGIASVSLAMVVNEIAEGFFHSGGFLIIAGIAILVVGHTVNIGLGILGGFLHSLRLEYVEFFTKFFKGGAKRYIPFGMREP